METPTTRNQTYAPLKARTGNVRIMKHLEVCCVGQFVNLPRGNFSHFMLVCVVRITRKHFLMYKFKFNNSAFLYFSKIYIYINCFWIPNIGQATSIHPSPPPPTPPPPPPPVAVIAAVGMHPFGMHSCYRPHCVAK